METEIEFAKLFGDVISSTNKEDKKEHWDILVQYKIDVKGLKKIRRSDAESNENIHWVEIKNVEGLSGWLYGEADYFAFETFDYFIIVEKNKLQKLIAEKTTKTYTENPTLYFLYKRESRKDVLTLVKTIDLIYISDEIICKK